MVSKITLIEPHFDGAQFGPTVTEEELSGGQEPDSPPQSDSGDESKSRLVTFLQGATVFVVMFVVLYVALRRVGDEE